MKIQPTVLGLKKTFGFGDRLGLATPGHLAALRSHEFLPVLAQQSVREMSRTNRTPREVMSAAIIGIEESGFGGAWGADADHLKTLEDVETMAEAGFTWFTIDPSAYVGNHADSLDAAGLDAALGELVSEKILSDEILSDYLASETDLETGVVYRFDRIRLARCAVKYGRALHHVEQMARAIALACSGRSFEMELSVDETDLPTSPLDHLFIAKELKRRSVSIISLAPRFSGEMEKGIDYRGDPVLFEKELTEHVAIARHFGPYKISIHSGSDKFSIYPLIGRCCGELLHVKTAGTSYLEALRVVARIDPDFFEEIAVYCADRFSQDRASYHISTTTEEVVNLFKAPSQGWESIFLDHRVGRQMLHVTFGSVLTLGKRASGQLFKKAILEILRQHSDLHKEVLMLHFERHLNALSKG